VKRDFKTDLKLDKNNLDICAMEQPELFAEWGMKWADAVDTRDRLKDQLALARSEADAEIRATPSEFGWTKPDKAPTEAFINSAICSHKDYGEANEEYLDACREVNELAIAKEAFQQRKNMIEVLTELYKSSYFSGNKKLDENYQEAMDRASSDAQTESLAANPRLIRRKLGTAPVSD
jgi:hypothetical protein